MAGIIVSPRARIFHGHDWVYATEIKKVFGNPQPGDVIAIKDFRDRFIGTAIYNPQSQIVARRFSRQRQDLDLDFFIRRFTTAKEIREQSGINIELARLVSSEADALPGLIVDNYNGHLVLQALTLAMSLRINTVAEALVKVFKPKSILLRNDSPSLQPEGLEQNVCYLYGSQPEPFVVENAGIKFLVNLASGQKTGLYLDQMHNYHRAAKYAKDRVVADCFSNQGGFALACALAGAKQVTAIDVSEEAIEAVKVNAKLNGLSNLQAECINAFDWLKQTTQAKLDGKEVGFDYIILDPPSFTRNRKSLRDAMRGYKEIHLRAMQILPKGGILSTYCCSFHASSELFLESITEAAVDAKATPRMLAQHMQGLDHPILPTLPETHYLKGFSFSMLPGR